MPTLVIFVKVAILMDVVVLPLESLGEICMCQQFVWYADLLLISSLHTGTSYAQTNVALATSSI